MLFTPFNLLADIELRYEKIDLAYHLTKEAVRRCKKSLTRQNFMVASAFFHFARALNAQGKSGQARCYINEEIGIKTSLNKNHPAL